LPAVSIASRYETAPAKLWFAGAVDPCLVVPSFAVSVIFAAAALVIC
jgi:hypothetical protein